MFYLGTEWNHFNQVFWNLSTLLFKVSNISGMFVNFIHNATRVQALSNTWSALRATCKMLGVWVGGGCL